jgi:hypothetical protein
MGDAGASTAGHRRQEPTPARLPVKVERVQKRVSADEMADMRSLCDRARREIGSKRRSPSPAMQSWTSCWSVTTQSPRETVRKYVRLVVKTRQGAAAASSRRCRRR